MKFSGGYLTFPRQLGLELTVSFLLFSAFGGFLYIQIAGLAQFHLRFLSRHNTDNRANGESTANSKQAFGAYWSKVTPPELLYIWLLSLDELRLAMKAHLLVVRPLVCYARRGATPMHQKKMKMVIAN